MTPKQKIILASSAVILVGGLMIMKYLKNRPKNNIEGLPEIAKDSLITQQQQPTIEKLKPVPSFPLQKGIIGIEVKDLQNWLNTNKYSIVKLDEDGKFGTFTENAVKLMQKSPKFSDIIDYKNQEAFTDPMQSGKVSKKFYDYFVSQTKKYIKTQSGFPINL